MTSMANLSLSKVAPDMSKLEPLDGSNYRRWSQKLLIFFEYLEIDYVLFEDPSKFTQIPATTIQIDITPARTSSSRPTAEEIKKYEKDNKTVRGHLLNHMVNGLFDLFIDFKSSKEIWDILFKKYGSDDAGRKKYVVGNWLRFQIQDDKPIMEQVHVYENLVGTIIAEGMKMCETLQANVLLEKFPPSWSEYRNHLKHKKKDMTLQELISHMRTEEANRLKDKMSTLPLDISKANLIESNDHGKKEKFRKKVKKLDGNDKNKGGKFKGPSKSDEKFKKKQVSCYVCGKSGHKAYQCRHRKNKDQKIGDDAQVNVTEHDNVIAAVIETNLVENKTEWIVDSGATRHYCNNKDLFAEFEETNGTEPVYMGNQATAGVHGKGKVFLKLTSGKTLSLSDTLYVPSLRRNIVSGVLLNKVGLKQVIEADKIIISKNDNFVGKAYLSGSLFVLNTVCASVNGCESGSAYIIESADVWHSRLGHVSLSSIKRLKTTGHFKMTNMMKGFKCPVCVEAKLSKQPFKSITSRSTKPLELIHSDLADFKNSISRGGKKYYVTFIDDYSRYTKLYLLNSKDEADQMFMIYKTEVENQLDRKIKRFRSDRGGEYSTTNLKNFCEEHGIIHEYSAPYTPQQNGVAERKNRTLKNMMNAMLLSSGLPDNMWGEAVLSACHILNRVPHKGKDKTPYELWKGYAPNLEFLRVWGCLAKVGLPDFKKSTIGPKSIDSVFIGYAQNSAAYRFMLLSDSSIMESCHAVFFEDEFPLKKTKEIIKSSDMSPVEIPSTSVVAKTIDKIESRRSKRSFILSTSKFLSAQDL
ncbi:hypothetical protein E3N88_35225 [Mikania micrantha]|uniref:Integrase catalytic domain-containing protein n=1 Tax=Mikania micrantha TaxID=192012 RepID=A0A5N6M0D2_9ASTR|nr:hypothetical protein E3N88_35225 [Mikania micrantha]